MCVLHIIQMAFCLEMIFDPYLFMCNSYMNGSASATVIKVANLLKWPYVIFHPHFFEM